MLFCWDLCTMQLWVLLKFSNMWFYYLYTGYVSSRVEFQEQLSYKHQRLEKGWFYLWYLLVCRLQQSRVQFKEKSLLGWNGQSKQIWLAISENCMVIRQRCYVSAVQSTCKPSRWSGGMSPAGNFDKISTLRLNLRPLLTHGFYSYFFVIFVQISI